MRVCELSDVNCGFAGRSFQVTQHHDFIINFLTSEVAMRLQLRVPYPEKVMSRVESVGSMGHPRCER